VQPSDPVSPPTALLTRNDTIRESTFSENTRLRIVNALHLTNRPPPDLISGDYQPAKSEDAGAPLYISQEVLEQLERGSPLPDLNVGTLKGLPQAIEASFRDDEINDDRLHFENLLDTKTNTEDSYISQSNHCKSVIL
jgi:hypothetical protein